MKFNMRNFIRILDDHILNNDEMLQFSKCIQIIPIEFVPQKIFKTYKLILIKFCIKHFK